MPEEQPTIRTRKISAVKNELSSLVNEVSLNGTRVLVERNGVPVAAIVSPDDLARLEEFERAWGEGTRVFERIGAAFADVPPAESEAEIARIIAELRQHPEVEAVPQPA
jgi:prevent-host-death family protein